MHAAPIQPRAMTQPAVRSDTGTNRPAKIAASGIHHASKLVRLLLSQSREVSVVGLLIADYSQHDEAPGSPARWAWIGGHGTEPYEQNTQQSRAFGFSFVPQPVHS